MPLPKALSTVAADEATSFRQHAFETLHRAIYDFTLLPGEELSEARLVEWLGMSRQPIRHALQRLADVGLVALANGKPPRVTHLDPARSNRALLVSGMYNIYAVERTVGRLTPVQLRRLDEVTREIATSARVQDWIRMGEGIQFFFEVFSNAVENPVLNEQMEWLTLELTRMLRPGASLVDVGALPPALSALNDAVQASDRDRAIDLTRALYATTVSNFEEQFRQ